MVGNGDSKSFVPFFAHRIIKSTGKRRSDIAMIISVGGLTLAIITVLITFTIVNGFRNALKEKILQLNPAIYIYNPYGNRDVTDEDYEQITALLTENGVTSSFDKAFQTGALLTTEDGFHDVIITADKENNLLKTIGEYIIDGTVDSVTNNGIILSKTVASTLGTGIGAKIDIAFPINGSLKYRRLTLHGIYDTGFDDFDKHFALTSLGFISKAGASTPGAMARLNLYFNQLDTEKINTVADEIGNVLNKAYANDVLTTQYAVGTILNDAASYWGWLAIMDVNIIVISALMAFIALFTLISSLTIIILDHVPAIGILKALGSPDTQIRKIFLLIGARLIFISLIISNIVCAVLIFTQNHWHWIELDSKTYYLDSVPMNFNWLLFVLTDVTVLACGITALLVPALIIKRISPCDVIKFK